ncbi:MAG: CARDB domain-containing protein [Pirellulaceae bacterium]
MRKQLTLSTIVLVALMAAFVASESLAQSSFQPPAKAEGQPFATPPRYLPPSTGGAVRQVSYQEEDVAVPAILGGNTAPAAEAPASAAPGATDAQNQNNFTAPAGQAQQMQPPQSPAQTGAPGAPVQLPRITAQPSQMPATGEPMNDMHVRPTAAATTTDQTNWLRSQPIETVETEAALSESPTTQEMTAPIIPDPIRQGGLIQSDGPKLSVISIGPDKISIGKTAQYEIQVQNRENQRAENIVVGINFPEWVEISSSVPTTGAKEITDGESDPIVVWEIPIVEAGSTEKIVIDVIPQEARTFDIDVEWTFVPIRGRATVEVTEPQLNIQISGPTDVQYGEKALYHVTVSNPGTGTAENVEVTLPDALGGERAALGNIEPQEQKKFQVELIARSAGTMDLTTTVMADGDLTRSDSKEIIVRRAVLDVLMEGPPMKYAGTTATYQLTVSNQGDAMARDVIAAIALPTGVEFVSGIDNVEQIDGGIRWSVGMLSPGNQRSYQITCSMGTAGDINIEAAAKGAGELAATNKVVTRVEAVADLVLTVEDPKGPLPIGQEIDYMISILNRGTRSARSVDIVMHFSEGVEPINAEGITYEITPGQVAFSPIAQIDPGEEVTLKVRANASAAGSHRFRAQLLCEESDLHEVAEGTTRFFGENTTPTDISQDVDMTSGFRR